jgi:threonine/homoserine/homoserine lactone efflux protein
LPELNLTVGPLAMFALVASITPGPNNLLVMRSGAAFGIRRTLWHVAGVEIGFAGLIILSHFGIGVLLLALPGAFAVLRWGCFAYLVWLAWLILKDGRPQASAVVSAAARPMRCIEAILFQLINPKAWMMSVTIVSAFYGSVAPSNLDVAVATLLCIAIGTPCILIWTAWGAAINQLLKQPRARQAFSYVMAVMVMGSAIWML